VLILKIVKVIAYTSASVDFEEDKETGVARCVSNCTYLYQSIILS